MNRERRRWLHNCVVARAASKQVPVSVGTLCEACLSVLHVDAAAATVIIAPGLQPLVGCSDQRSRDLGDRK